MNKKILAIFVLLIFATSITAVSAFDLGSIFGSDKNETVNIGGLDFNIPDGFEEEVSSKFVKDTVDTLKKDGINTTGKGYVKDSTAVGIFVSNYSDLNESDDVIKSKLEGNATKINGVDGFLKHDSDYTFTYTKDKCLVLIQTNDKDVIGNFLIA